MTELISFSVSLGLGLISRFLYLGATALAKRTNLFPVTVALDILTVLIIGGAFTAYVILFSVVLAPYMFAALGIGYYLAYSLTKKVLGQNPKKEKPKNNKTDKRAA